MEGNRKLREMSALKARQLFKGQLTNDPALRAAYNRWVDRYEDQKRTMNDDYRGVMRGGPVQRSGKSQ